MPLVPKFSCVLVSTPHRQILDVPRQASVICVEAGAQIDVDHLGFFDAANDFHRSADGDCAFDFDPGCPLTSTADVRSSLLEVRKGSFSDRR